MIGVLAARLTELSSELQLQVAAVRGCFGHMLPVICAEYPFDSSCIEAGYTSQNHLDD